MFLGVKTVAYGQLIDTVILQKYTQKDGLTSYNVRKICQDKWGFLWIATQDGISRFDGRSFINYTKNAAPERRICGTDVRELIEDTATNILWTLPAEVGISAINTVTGEILKNISIPGESNEDWNVSMLRRADELWIGTSTGVRIYNIQKNAFEKELALPAGEKGSVDFLARSLTLDQNGNVWVSYDGYGLVVYNGKTKQIIQQAALAALCNSGTTSEIRIYKAVLLGREHLLFATNQGLRSVRYSKNYQLQIDKSPCKVISSLNTKPVNYVINDAGNTVLVASFNSVYRFNYSLDSYRRIEEIRADETNWLSSVWSVYKDAGGNTWFGCQQGLGFVSKIQSPFKPYLIDPSANIKLDHVFAVSPIGNGNILVGLLNGLIEINSTNGKFIRSDTGHLYQHIFTDKKGLVHISRPDGLFIYNNHSIIPVHKIYPEFAPYFSYSINSHLFISDTLIILGTESNNGILLWNPLNKTVRAIDAKTSPVKLSSDIVNNIYREANGAVWVLSDNVITILSADLSSARTVELHDDKNSATYKLFFDMCEAGGSYWVASYGSGILQVDKNYKVKHVFNTANGLSNDGVYQIYNLSDKNLLVTSNSGISRIDLATGRISRYFEKDGLHFNAFEEVSGVMKDGKIYAGGVNGFTVVNPDRFLSNSLAPVVYFTSIEMQTRAGKTDTGNLHVSYAKIPNNVVQTSVHFIGLNYANPERTEYAYRIVEEGNDWININHQNWLQLIGRSAGLYTIQVKAANEDGVWSQPVQIQLYFQPKWYQTWWFKLLLLMAAAGAVYFVYRLRIRQFKREEAIRKNLARDLHDDLGSTINSVNVYTNLAMMEDGNNQYLNKIKKSTQDAMSGMRDIIWILDDKKDTIAQLCERVAQFAYPLCETSHIAFALKVDADAKNHVLKKQEKRNLYLIIKEAVNNSIKYAGATAITLSIRLDNNKLLISISDDGKGFDLQQVKKGNGLDNIERRSQEIGYAHSLQSANNHGTVIDLVKK